jgi:hypothetical protein
MNNTADFHVACARLQQQIETHLGMQGNLIYDFVNEDSKTKLHLITVNTRHNQSFLFHTTVGIDKLDALTKMLEYVRDRFEQENSYTLQWRAKDQKELHTSYFMAKNMYEALDKLYYNRDINAITVYSLVLNPLT